jgi:hypothetical protein
LVPRKLQNSEPTDLPVGALSKESFATFDTASSNFITSLEPTALVVGVCNNLK